MINQLGSSMLIFQLNSMQLKTNLPYRIHYQSWKYHRCNVKTNDMTKQLAYYKFGLSPSDKMATLHKFIIYLKTLLCSNNSWSVENSYLEQKKVFIATCLVLHYFEYRPVFSETIMSGIWKHSTWKDFIMGTDSTNFGHMNHVGTGGSIALFTNAAM